jgi:hypothetical protein
MYTFVLFFFLSYLLPAFNNVLTALAAHLVLCIRASTLAASLIAKQLAPVALITAPTLLIATVHLLHKATTGTDAPSRLLTLMLQHPARAIQIFVQTVIRRLLLPTWLREWLNNLSITVTEIRNMVNNIAYEATATGVRVDEYSLVMGRLCETFEDFVTSSAHIGEIAQRAIAAVIEVCELSFHTCTRVEDIYHHAFDTDENVNWLRGDLLQMEQVIEQRTAHIADINLQLALNTIHARLGQLQRSIEALPIQTSPTSPDNSNQTLSPLPADTLCSAILPHLASAPSLRSSEALSNINEGNEEELTLAPSLLYNITLAPWGDPQVFRSDLAVSWENRTWQTGTYCGLSYKFFTNGPPHAQCFTGVSSRSCCCFAFSKRGLGKLIGQDKGLAFSMSEV